MSEPTGVVATNALTGRLRREVETLATLCRRHDGLELMLQLEPSPQRERNNQFLRFAGGTLVGFACVPSGDDIEVLGMVHPEHRRRRIGLELIDAVRRECRVREARELLIVTERASRTARAFARAAGGGLAFSEHRMEHSPEFSVPREPLSPELAIRKAQSSDIATLAHLQALAFGTDPDRSTMQLAQWLTQPNQRIYICSRDGDAIGMVRLAALQSGVFITSLAVAPTAQRQGVGRALLRWSVQLLTGEGRTPIALEVETRNDTALGLYRAAGFREVTTYDYHRISVPQA
jgi:ribosomal protein S18 acetylase RimI-like enzyme